MRGEASTPRRRSSCWPRCAATAGSGWSTCAMTVAALPTRDDRGAGPLRRGSVRGRTDRSGAGRSAGLIGAVAVTKGWPWTPPSTVAGIGYSWRCGPNRWGCRTTAPIGSPTCCWAPMRSSCRGRERPRRRHREGGTKTTQSRSRWPARSATPREGTTSPQLMNLAPSIGLIAGLVEAVSGGMTPLAIGVYLSGLDLPREVSA